MPKTAPKPKVMVPRLPPYASKIHVWNGKEWEGQMGVLGELFKATASNEKGLLWKLDEIYRAWLKEQPDEVKAKHSAHLGKQV